MPPKKIVSGPNTKIPNFLKARAKKKSTNENELDKLMNMTTAEIFPYVCFLTAIVLLIIYNIVPSLFKYLVEFQYGLEEEKKEEIGANPGMEKRPTVQFFETGVLDFCHLLFLFLGVESFEVFVSEMLQAAAKYLLKAPKKIQEIFVRTGVSTSFHLLVLFSGFGLLQTNTFLSSEAFWGGVDSPISRTQKFYLLIQVAFQISILVNYFLNVPQKSWKPLNIAGAAIGILVTFIGYFSGFFAATTLVLIVYDISLLFFELKTLLDCVAFQKPENSLGKQLIPSVKITWLVTRILIPLLLVVWFMIAQPLSILTKEPLDTPFFLLAGVFGLIAMQAVWYLEIAKKLEITLDKGE
jgi:hypothetical protein